MIVTDLLTGEHGVFHLLVEQLDDALGRCESLAELRAAASPLAISLLGHQRVEEQTLFVPVERELGPKGPTLCLRHEHQQMDARLRALFRIADVGALRDELRGVLDLTRRHLAREEEVLFAVARRTLAVDELVHLGAHWAEHRGVQLPR